MGIPSYFSHIIKNHADIIHKFWQGKGGERTDILLIDSNSIIYDSMRNINYEEYKNDILFEKELINMVYLKLREYIKLVSPRERTYIAFDGVAPVAKLQQQRNRRYKSRFEKKIIDNKEYIQEIINNE